MVNYVLIPLNYALDFGWEYHAHNCSPISKECVSGAEAASHSLMSQFVRSTQHPGSSLPNTDANTQGQLPKPFHPPLRAAASLILG